VIDLRIVVPAAAAWVAAIVILPAPAAMLPLAIAAWIAAVLLIGVSWLARRPVLVVMAVSAAAVALVATSAFVHSDARRPAFLERGAHALVGASVVTTQTVTRDTKHFTATLTRVNRSEVSVPVMIFDESPSRRTEIGSTLRVTGSITTTSPEDEVSFLVFATAPAKIIAPPPCICRGPTGSGAVWRGHPHPFPATEARCCPGSRSVTPLRSARLSAQT
jgi:competence protein ComEC